MCIVLSHGILKQTFFQNNFWKKRLFSEWAIFINLIKVGVVNLIV